MPEELPDAKGKGTAGKVFQWLVIVSMAASIINQYVNPEYLAIAADKALIHNEVGEAVANSHDKEVEDLEESLAKVRASNTRAHKLITTLERKTLSLENQIATVIEIQDANQLHRQFNTQAISIVCDAVTEEMDKKENACGWAFYETNGGDNWNIFTDKYESNILYSVDLRTDCRAFYTPIFGSKTKAN
jgi:hypothetical protein